MSCGCGNCDCERLREQVINLQSQRDELQAHILILVALEEKRHDAEKQFGRALVEARGKAGERSA